MNSYFTIRDKEGKLYPILLQSAPYYKPIFIQDKEQGKINISWEHCQGQLPNEIPNIEIPFGNTINIVSDYTSLPNIDNVINNSFYYAEDTSVLYYPYTNDENQLIWKPLTDPDKKGVEIVSQLPEEGNPDLPYFIPTTQDIYSYNENDNKFIRYTHKVIPTTELSDIIINQTAQEGDLIVLLEDTNEELESAENIEISESYLSKNEGGIEI